MVQSHFKVIVSLLNVVSHGIFSHITEKSFREDNMPVILQLLAVFLVAI